MKLTTYTYPGSPGEIVTHVVIEKGETFGHGNLTCGYGILVIQSTPMGSELWEEYDYDSEAARSIPERLISLGWIKS